MFNYLKTQGGKTTIKVVATLLAITLTFANFILLGSYLGKGNVSYATDANATNVDNVKFNVYLDEAKTLNTVTKDINSTDLKLYVDVQVLNQGYLEGAKLTLTDTNFYLKSNENQKNIDLGTIKAGSTSSTSYEIVAKKDVAFNVDWLNMDSKITLTGTYKNTTDTNVNSEKTVHINYTANKDNNDNFATELTSNIISNEVVAVNGTNKRIIQQEITSNIKGNSYPIKSTYIEAIAPVLGAAVKPESVTVASCGTVATNGQYLDFGKSTDSKSGSYEYDSTNNKVKITVNNTTKGKIISWEKGSSDIFVVTYVYPESSTATKIDSNVTDKITLYLTDETIVPTATTTATTTDFSKIPVSPILTVSSPDSIYKGNMKIGQDTDFKTLWMTAVTDKDLMNSVVLTNNENADEFNSDAVATAATYFKTTYINKDQMINLLGDAGTITITDEKGTTLATVDKNTATETIDGLIYYKVTYTTSPSIIMIKTTAPTNEGVLAVINDKAIKYSDTIKN
jgi:hypothetical protein